MYSAIAANKRNTLLIMGTFVLLLVGLAWGYAYLTQDTPGAVFVTVFIVGYTVFQYFASTRIAMALAGAVPIDKSVDPRLWNIVENLAITEGMPMPKVCIIDDISPNAFAAGRDPEHAVVAFTTGLLDIMDDNELAGVAAHELSHVRNYDIRVTTIVFGLIAAIGMVADGLLRITYYGGRGRDNKAAGILMLAGLVAWVVAWLIGPLVAAAISRQREFLADASAIHTTRYPEGLASALEKLSTHKRPMMRASKSMAHMYLRSPSGKDRTGWFDTHPSITSRIDRLRAMGGNF